MSENVDPETNKPSGFFGRLSLGGKSDRSAYTPEKKLDPVLAERFARQQKKQETGEGCVGDIGSAADQTMKLDPVLARRFAQQQEKCETGESSVKHIGSAASIETKFEPTLARRMLSQQEKLITGESKVENVGSQADKSTKFEPVLKERLEKQQRKVITGESECEHVGPGVRNSIAPSDPILVRRFERIARRERGEDVTPSPRLGEVEVSSPGADGERNVAGRERSSRARLFGRAAGAVIWFLVKAIAINLVFQGMLLQWPALGQSAGGWLFPASGMSSAEAPGGLCSTLCGREDVQAATSCIAEGADALTATASAESSLPGAPAASWHVGGVGAAVGASCVWLSRFVLA